MWPLVLVLLPFVWLLVTVGYIAWWLFGILTGFVRDR